MNVVVEKNIHNLIYLTPAYFPPETEHSILKIQVVLPFYTEATQFGQRALEINLL